MNSGVVAGLAGAIVASIAIGTLIGGGLGAAAGILTFLLLVAAGYAFRERLHAGKKRRVLQTRTRLTVGRLKFERKRIESDQVIEGADEENGSG